MRFLDRLHAPSPILLDGAMGTLIYQHLPRYTGCIELLNLERPDVIRSVHAAYIESGAEIIETNTFGANPLKLAEYGLASRCLEINREAACIAREAAGGRSVFIAGSMGPTGKLIEPMGETSVEEARRAFSMQASALCEGGVDLIIIETMSDLLEAKTALLAARDSGGVPVLCSMTFEENGATVSGTDMLAGLATLSQCGADAVGANCSMGPDGLASLFTQNARRLRDLGIPLMAWANAGLPELVQGLPVYSLPARRFAEISSSLLEEGIKIIGGCCGTTPLHISALREMMGQTADPGRYKKTYRHLTSRFTALDITAHDGLLVIGERLNPTARKKFAAELKAGQFTFLREESRKQEHEGAHVLDINVGVPGVDEAGVMRQSVAILSSLVKTPLMIDSDNPAVLDTALRMNPGTGIINSINGKRESLEAILPLAKRYGSFVVALCLDESGIHRDAASRIKIGERLLDILLREGIDPGRVLVDPLMLAESAEPGAAMETLRVIAHFAGRAVHTSLGLSNISFGLPGRKHVNAAFLKLALDSGLRAAIINPSLMGVLADSPEEEVLARSFLMGDDPGAARYIRLFRQKEDSAPRETAGPAGGTDVIRSVYDMVVDGNVDDIVTAVDSALITHSPEAVMNDGLLKALERVGELYSTGEYFLPQMIASANAMKKGFGVVKPHLAAGPSRRQGKVVICTVKGDVHDIGKNIVAMMLENHGFEVIDLGKDVPAESVMKALRAHAPHILALSSLLTTTMHEMAGLASMIRGENLPVKLLVGGAVVNREFAESIGAHYGEDAVAGVQKARELLEA